MEVTIKFNREFKSEQDVALFMSALLGTAGETMVKLDTEEVETVVKEKPITQTKTKTKKAEELSDTEMVEPIEAKEEPKSAVKLADLQKLFTQIIKTSPAKKDDAVQILADNGAKRLSELEESTYPAVKEALDALIGG